MSLARLASVLEPLEFESGECSSSDKATEITMYCHSQTAHKQCIRPKKSCLFPVTLP